MAVLQRTVCKLYSRDSRCFEFDSSFNILKILNASGFLMCYSFKGYIDRVLNMLQVLNMLEF